MDVTLPSGQTVTLRDVFTRGDRVEAQRGLSVVVQPDGTQRLDGATTSEVAGRILRQMITGWSFPGPWPAQAGTRELGDRILNDLTDDDATALEDAIDPWVKRVTRPSGRVLTHVPSGIKVTPVTAGDAAKLAELPDFEAADGEGPKSRPSGTSTSESLALPGPAETTGPTP